MLDKIYYVIFFKDLENNLLYFIKDLKVFYVDAKDTVYALTDGGDMIVTDKYVYGEGDHMYACNYQDFEKRNIDISEIKEIYHEATSRTYLPMIQDAEKYITYLDMLINMIDKYEESHEGVRPKKYYEQLIRDRKAKLKELNELHKKLEELSFVEETVWMAYLSLQV